MANNETNYEEAARREAAAAHPTPSRTSRRSNRLLGAILLGIGVMVLLGQGLSALVRAARPARSVGERVAAAEIEREMAQVEREMERVGAEIEREMAGVEREMERAAVEFEREMAQAERAVVMPPMPDMAEMPPMRPMPEGRAEQRPFGPSFIWPSVALGAALFKIVVVPLLIVAGILLLARRRRSTPPPPASGPAADHAR